MPHKVNITPASNGLVIRIGCKLLVVPKAEVGPAFIDLYSYLFGGYQEQEAMHRKWFPEDFTESQPPPPQPIGNACIEQTSAQPEEF